MWDELPREKRRLGQFQVERRQRGPRRRQMGTPWQGPCRGVEGGAGGKEANTDTEVCPASYSNRLNNPLLFLFFLSVYN